MVLSGAWNAPYVAPWKLKAFRFNIAIIITAPNTTSCNLERGTD
jgi:hypothetical protein